MDLRPDFDVILGAFGAACTVTPVGAASIATTVIVRGPSKPSPDDPRAAGTEQLKEASLPKSAVTVLPRNSRIVISEGADAGEYVTGNKVREDAEEIVVHITKVDA